MYVHVRGGSCYYNTDRYKHNMNTSSHKGADIGRVTGTKIHTDVDTDQMLRMITFFLWDYTQSFLFFLSKFFLPETLIIFSITKD